MDDLTLVGATDEEITQYAKARHAEALAGMGQTFFLGEYIERLKLRQAYLLHEERLETLM